MNIINRKENNLIKINQFLDYIPIVSTFTNLIDIFLKAIVNLLQLKPSKSNHYFSHIQNKELFRCFVLLVPFFGNITLICLNNKKNFIPFRPPVVNWNESKEEIIDRTAASSYHSVASSQPIGKREIAFANLLDLSLSDLHFGEILRRINHSTLIKLSQIDLPSRYAPGIEGAKNAKIFQILLKWLEKSGSDATKKDISFPSPQEIDHSQPIYNLLTLAAYLLFSGELQDSFTAVRSAQIFSIYAEQFLLSQGTKENKLTLESVSWVESLMREESSFHSSSYSSRTSTFEKIFTLIKTVSKITTSEAGKAKELYKDLLQMVDDLTGSSKHSDKTAIDLLLLSEILSRSTGSHNKESFYRCSVDGKYCWEELQKENDSL